MKIQKNIVTGALAMAGVAGLVGCGDEKGSQDVGTNAPAAMDNRALYARVIDGYIAGANVYVDQNENGKLDAFEPRAVTDKDGFFSYNHVTGTDYCADGVSAELEKHCLRAPIGASGDLLIRVTGGYDTVTGRPFQGTLSLRAKDLKKDDLRLVTPLTSLVAHESETDPETLGSKLKNAGIISGNDSLMDDYIDNGNTDMAMKMAMVNKIVELLGKGANNAGGISEDLKNHTINVAYTTFGDWAEDLGPNFDFEETFAADKNRTLDMLRETTFRVIHPGEPMPEDFMPPNPDALLEQAQALQSVVQESLKLAEKSVQTDSRLMNALLRTQTLLMERAANNPQDPELSDIQQWVDNQLSQPNGVGEDLARLGDDDIDISALIDPSFNFDPASNSISASAVIPPEAAQVFASLVNTMFRINVNKGDQQGAALVFISGASGASSGKLDVCVRYKDSSGDFDTGNASNPNGALLVNGSWSLINNHTLTLNVEVAGGVRPLLIKSVGAVGSDLKYRFDFGGDFSEWLGSAPEPFTVSAVPTSDATCETALIEAFGPVT